MKGSVLIVEDDFYIREALKDFLEGEGVSVACAENGHAALDYLRNASHPPNLILLDLMMPVKDGFAFRAEQSKDPRLAGIPVVVMTADSRAQDGGESIACDVFLKKPIELDQIIRVLERFLPATA